MLARRSWALRALRAVALRPRRARDPRRRRARRGARLPDLPLQAGRLRRRRRARRHRRRAASVNQQGYVSPNVLHWTQSGTLMVMVILGGVATLWGGVARRRGAAAAAGTLLSAVHRALGVLDRLGAAAVVLFARQGMAGAAAALAGARCCALLDVRACASASAAWSRPIGVDLQVRRRRGARADRPERRRQDDAGGAARRPARAATAAASSSTAPTSPRCAAHQRARRGLARSFQITRLFQSFSVLDNVALAVQAAAGASCRAWRPVRARTRRCATSARTSCWRRSASSTAGHSRRAAVARRAARARSRHGAGEPAAAGAARRADGRHGARRIGAHGSADRGACATQRRCC